MSYDIYNCPKCGSSNTQKLSLANAAGIFKIIFCTFDKYGDISFLEEPYANIPTPLNICRLLPPSEPEFKNSTGDYGFGWGCISIPVLFLVSVCIAAFIKDEVLAVATFFFLPFLIAPIIGHIATVQKKKSMLAQHEEKVKIYEKELEIYNALFLCMRCSHVYLPVPPDDLELNDS